MAEPTPAPLTDAEREAPLCGSCRRGQHGVCDSGFYLRCECLWSGHNCPTLTTGPDGVPGSDEPWASGLRGAVLTGLMSSQWAAEAGPIRATVMRDLYAEVADLLAAARIEALTDAAAALEAQPPKTRAHYVSVLRLYAAEPWRLAPAAETAASSQPTDTEAQR